MELSTGEAAKHINWREFQMQRSLTTNKAVPFTTQSNNLILVYTKQKKKKKNGIYTKFNENL